MWIHGHTQIPRKMALALSIFGKALGPAVDSWNAELGTECVPQADFEFALGNMAMVDLPNDHIGAFEGVLAMGGPKYADPCRPGGFQNSDFW